MSRKPSKPETRIEDYLDVMTGGDAALPQPILRIEFYYAFLAGMAVELPQPILDDEKLLAKICGMEVEAPTYIPGLSPRLYAYMAKKGGQDVQVPDPILRLERYWYDYSASTPPSEQEYTGAVPVTFVADGTPLLDYLISGNEEHSGTPAPDNPVMPQGTGERTGNLFDGEYPNIGGTVRYRALHLGNGTYTLSSTVEISQGSAGTLFFLAGNVSSGASTATNAVYKDRPITVTSTDGYVTIAYRTYTTDTPVGKENMLNSGSTALPYEPYGVKIPISSAGQTTPVYLGEVQTTRKIGKLVLTGEEHWQFYSDNTGAYGAWQFFVNNVTNGLPMSSAQSNIADYGVTAMTRSNYLYGVYLVTSGTGVAFQMAGAKDIFTDINAWKTYLAQQYAAGTPVTVWYVLATPVTAVVNEPLMKIGDYADTLSMEQAGVSIPTADGSTTLDVETTVKPSEVYIKYLGEAVATLSALPAEVSSPEETTEEENPEETEEEENER